MTTLTKLDFSAFKAKVKAKFAEIKNASLFVTDVDKNVLWETYMASFPEGTNPIFRERREYECNNCMNFIRNIGNCVAWIDGQLVSIWDIEVSDQFQVVADALSKLVKSKPVKDRFFYFQDAVGIESNFELTSSLQWSHLHVILPKGLVKKEKDIPTELNNYRTNQEVFYRALTELTEDSLDMTIDLIKQGSLYRGDEFLNLVEGFKSLQVEFKKLNTDLERVMFSWVRSITAPPSIVKIKNSAIGTLLIDLSEGKNLTDSVNSFEAKVAPTNYKRPTALVTKAMIEKAKIRIEELGYTESLSRRFAQVSDISVNDIIFVDNDTRKKIDNVFDLVASKVPSTPKSLDKVEEISIEDFIANVVPKATSIEVMFDSKHINNLVSLIAPVHPESRNMFKWDSKLSYSYNGNLADSIKERVKKAGGDIEGVFCSRLEWFNTDDLDLSVEEPSGEVIYYNHMRSRSGGVLDVDMNRGSGNVVRDAVENVVYKNLNTMKPGRYLVMVNNYTQREVIDVGFNVQLELLGKTYNISHPKMLKGRVIAAEVTLKDGEFTVKSDFSLESSRITKEVWGITTNTFHKVNVLTLSPNYWGEKPIGNKHYFFMLEGCRNDGRARGFFNEFLDEKLSQERKVMEVVGNTLEVQPSENQLSGLGFSSTQRNSVLVKVQGTFNRMLKVLF